MLTPCSLRINVTNFLFTAGFKAVFFSNIQRIQNQTHVCMHLLKTILSLRFWPFYWSTKLQTWQSSWKKSHWWLARGRHHKLSPHLVLTKDEYDLRFSKAWHLHRSKIRDFRNLQKNLQYHFCKWFHYIFIICDYLSCDL